MSINTSEVFPMEVVPEQQTAAEFLEARGLQNLAQEQLLDHQGKPMSFQDAIDRCPPIRDQVEASLELAREYAPEDVTGFIKKALISRAAAAAPEVAEAKKKDN